MKSLFYVCYIFNFAVSVVLYGREKNIDYTYLKTKYTGKYFNLRRIEYVSKLGFYIRIEVFTEAKIDKRISSVQPR
jgi:hypothetical protein